MRSANAVSRRDRRSARKDAQDRPSHTKRPKAAAAASDPRTTGSPAASPRLVSLRAAIAATTTTVTRTTHATTRTAMDRANRDDERRRRSCAASPGPTGSSDPLSAVVSRRPSVSRMRSCNHGGHHRHPAPSPGYRHPGRTFRPALRGRFWRSAAIATAAKRQHPK
ncbi:hypothetical protein GCM10012276_36290 [Nocardioides deserti]|nr:hypothetical protein GCM10012276_36290 [Nocardioides deserti]